MWKLVIEFIRAQYRTEGAIPLHAPVFVGNERSYVNDTLDTTFVSSIGSYVDRFERSMAAFTKSPGAVATVNGTAALHVALRLTDVGPGDLVITQPLTFVATCNAIAYCGATPVFVDVDRRTLGLSPNALESWLKTHAEVGKDGLCRRIDDGRIIRACVPMHTFGHPVELDRLVALCARWKLSLIEDAAESLGSLYRGRHTGTFGSIGVLSFNGNKIVTTGGGGMILSDEVQAKRARFLTTTAKNPHPFEYVHEEVGFNYRMPNINAALGCAQLEQLEAFVEAKRLLAHRYRDFFASGHWGEFFLEPAHCRSNYWLNALICQSREERDELLAVTNRHSIGTRPVWRCMHQLPAFAHCPRGDVGTAELLQDRIINLPSSVPVSQS
jgi:aminotransferase in exopolysaccharide biosynthesis